MARSAPQTKTPAKVKEYWVMWLRGDPLAPGLNEQSLALIGIDLLNSRLPVLYCRSCRHEWSPPVQRYRIPAMKEYRTEARIDNVLPIGWWRCPTGCTAKAARRLHRQRMKPRKEA
jgi:hypothetical protein